MNTPFRLLQENWIQIAPVGDHPHEQGMQRIDAACIAEMAARFNSFGSRLGRLFSGAPLFEGHHDCDPEKYPNGKSFGWVMRLEDRKSEGLWGELKWTAEGRELVSNGAYKFVSPLWTAREMGRENGQAVFRPEKLLSLALTNLPNLPLLPLANDRLTSLSAPDRVVRHAASENSEPTNDMKKITEILGLKEESTADEICMAAETLANARSGLAERLEAVERRVGEERSARIELILANAIANNRLTLAERDHWAGELQKNFDGAQKELETRTTGLNTTSMTRDLGNEKNLYDTAAARREALLGFMNEQMARGMTHEAAWEKAKIEKAEIFRCMKG